MNLKNPSKTIVKNEEVKLKLRTARMFENGNRILHNENDFEFLLKLHWGILDYNPLLLKISQLKPGKETPGFAFCTVGPYG